MDNIKGLIGNTPLIKIRYKYKGIENYIYTKLEYYNLTGSIKDRIVYYILDKAIEEGKLIDNMPLIEATSGNTGISLSALGAYLNHPVYIFMPDWVSKERLDLMKLYGANVILVSKEDGGFKTCVELAKEFSVKHNGFLLNQFSNNYNVEAHYKNTAKEIIDKLNVDCFVSGIGTGGTLIGIGKKLKEVYNTDIYALEPDTMSIIKTGNISSHKIEGIGDDFIPDIVDLNLIKDIILVSDMDAINMSKKLSKELGIGVGISSGANMIASILLKEMGYKNVVTVFPDDNKKYLSTDLTKDIELKDDNISSKVALLGYEVI
ncbi:MAG: cysteine synthase family protein [Bacilli bacterium]|nr:cysteine synthase family protein [Bacilli bacterium]